MNIFVVSSDPAYCAQMLDDKRVNKMLVETTQMLAAAMYRGKVPAHLLPKNNFGVPYKNSYPNHPCTQWAGDNRANFNWLLTLGEQLALQYTKRFQKHHACEEALKAIKQLKPFDFLPNSEKPTEFVNCSLYKNITPVTEAYIQTMLNKWLVTDKYNPRWSIVSPPTFLTTAVSSNSIEIISGKFGPISVLKR